jgi:hypothetical protein
MAKHIHDISLISGSQIAFQDRLHIGLLQVPYGAGTGNGVAVTATLAAGIPPGALVIPASSAFGSVVATQTASGLSVTITPPTGQTLAAGSAGVLVVA